LGYLDSPARCVGGHLSKNPTTGLRAAVRACRNLFAWTVLFSAGINLLYLAPSIFMMQIYDRVLNTGGLLTLALLGVVLLFALSVLAMLDLTRARLGARVGLRLNRLLSRQVIELGFTPGRSGDVQRSQAARDFDTLRQVFASPAAFAILDAPWTLVFVAVCFMIHPLIGALTLAGGLILLLIALRNEHAMRPIIERTTQLAPRYYAAQEADRGASEAVRALGMRGVLIDRQLERRQELLVEQTRASMMQAAYGSTSRFWRLLLQSGVLAAGAYLAVNGQISPGALIAGSILAARALAPLEQMVAGLRQVEQARVAFRNLTALIDDAPAESDRTSLPAPCSGLRFERVSVRVPDTDRLALGGVGFAADCGQVLGIIGPSGAGKSTLARIAAGAIPPDAGVVRLDGANLAHWDSNELGKHIGYLPQEVALLAGAVGENIRRFAPASAETDALTIAAAQAAGAHEMILRLPKGYDTMLGPQGRGVSLGQAQRIALARALYDDPVLLVLDEPNAHLDNEGEIALIQAINKAKARGAAVITIAHRAGVIAAVDRVMVLRDGAVDKIGPRDEIMRTLAQAGAGNLTPIRARENQ
jgi:PrtD family type I secretion system ABC transporter